MPTIIGRVSGTYGSHYTFYMDFSYTQNIAANTSTITAKTYLRKDKASQTAYSNNAYATQTVNGVTRSTGSAGSVKYDFRNSSLKLMQTETYTVAHNANGTKSITISAYAHLNTTLLSSASLSSTVTLPTIPRASGFTLESSSVAAGGSTTASIQSNSPAFRHNVIYSIGSYSSRKDSVVSSALVDIPIGWLNAIPKASSGTVTVKVDTLSGGTVIGSATKTLTMTTPATAKPILNQNPVITGNKLLDGYYVEGKSTVTVEMSGAGQYGAAIASYYGSANGQTFSTQRFTTSELKSAENGQDIQLRITDTRGLTDSLTRKTAKVWPYTAPVIRDFSVYRCNEDGTEDENGSYAKVLFNSAVTAVGMPNVNIPEYRIQYGYDGGSVNTIVIDNRETDIAYASAPIPVSTEYSYTFIVSVKDRYTTVTQEGFVTTAQVALDFHASGKGIAIGKVAEREEILDVEWPANFKELQLKGISILDIIHPVGSVYISVNNINPSLIYGGEWERFAQGRTLVGLSDSDADFDAAEKIGGAKTHKHDLAGTGYANIFISIGGGIIGARTLVGNLTRYNTEGTFTKTNMNVSYDNNARTDLWGTTGTDSTLQPYITCYMWKRVG